MSTVFVKRDPWGRFCERLVYLCPFCARVAPLEGCLYYNSFRQSDFSTYVAKEYGNTGDTKRQRDAAGFAPARTPIPLFGVQKLKNRSENGQRELCGARRSSAHGETWKPMRAYSVQRVQHCNTVSAGEDRRRGGPSTTPSSNGHRVYVARFLIV